MVEFNDDSVDQIVGEASEEEVRAMLEQMPEGELFAFTGGIEAQYEKETNDGTRALALIQTSLLPKEVKFEGYDPDRELGDDLFSVKITEEQEERIFEIVKNQVESIEARESDSGYDKAVEIYRKIYDLSSFQRTDDPYKNASNIHLGIPATKVDTFAAKSVKNILSIPRTSLVAGTKRGLDEVAKEIGDLLYWHNIKIDPIRDVFHQAIKQAGVEGNGIIYVSWHKREQKKTIFRSYKDKAHFRSDFRNKPEGLNSTQEVEYNNLLKRFKKNKFRNADKVKVSYSQDVVNNPIAEVIPTDQFLTNASELDFSDATFIGHVSHKVKYSYLKEMWDAKLFINEDKFSKNIDTEDITKDYFYNDHSIYNVLIYMNIKDSEEPQWYRVIFSLGDSAENDNGGEECILAVRTYEAFHQELPYVNVCPYPKYDGTWRGYSLIERSWTISQYIDEVMNDGLKANKLANNPFVILDEDSSMDLGNDFTLTPGGYLYAGKNERFDIQQFPQPPFTDQQYIGLMGKYVDSLTGISELAEGQNLGSDPGAPGVKVTALLNESLIRIDDPIENIKSVALSKYNSLILKWYYQYQPNGIFYRRILGSGAVTFEDKFLEADQYTLDLDFAPLPQTSTFNRELMKQELLQLYQILGANPYFNKYPQFQWNLIRDIANLGSLPDVDEYTPGLQELQQIVKDTAAIGVQEFQAQQQAEQERIKQEAARQNKSLIEAVKRDKDLEARGGHKALLGQALTNRVNKEIEGSSGGGESDADVLPFLNNVISGNV